MNLSFLALMLLGVLALACIAMFCRISDFLGSYNPTEREAAEILREANEALNERRK